MSRDRPSSSFGDPGAQPPTPTQTPTSAVFPSPVLATPRLAQGSLTPRFAENYSVFNSTPGNLDGGQARFEGFPPFTPSSHRDGLDPKQQHPANQTSLQLPGSGSLPSQTTTPPPTAHRRNKFSTLEPLTMNQDGQDFGQPDFSTAPQQPTDFNPLLASPGDIFSYPMSAPVTAPETFWDPASFAMSMDMDFNTSNIFPSEHPTTGHRHSASFDWNNEPQMFQDPPQPAQAPPPRANLPAKGAATKKSRPLAPKPPASRAPTAGTLTASLSMDNAFGITSPGAGIDPGNVFGGSRPSAPFSSFQATNAQASHPVAPATAMRRSNSSRDLGSSKAPDRAFASSPVKPSMPRPGLSRSQSENRGRRPNGKGAIVSQPMAPRPLPPSRSVPGLDMGRAMKTSGRVSPLKKQNRMSGLASIPESASRPSSRASVKFYIGADGRAHAQAAHSTVGPSESYTGPAARSSGQWDDGSEGSSSEDDEPIIIPSRNTSFNASFALPDPRRPVGSIFHPARRSISDKSTSTFAASADGGNNDMESEAETIMNDTPEHNGGDAASELLRVKENRQLMANQFSSAKAQRYFGMGQGTKSTSISPCRTDSGNTTDEPGVRCVCHNTEFIGFLVQCESCEMWQHGTCVNQAAQPHVYVCAFCANTPNMRGGRLRGSGRAGMDFGVATSPLASKSFRAFR
ncbi:uncharacterized protein F5Z01DRAFT_633994 [Emericellopsis atlantica]|uniref:Zinc finger PHD-type domain-containing protein n=1 Tax=Emericellopsis atlantica TaxID=2614577 RepID=A0A9P7ZRX9_9HYPO|nr:uncharacterized protein F5Z01DRAFT_633994 [Emericellopsis atlantica]KAG9257228.1 hypothetical protein F5Z01DRAFT_633994 [Emericellopsis atlantica]